VSQPPAGGYPPPDQSQSGGYPPPAQPGSPAGNYPPPPYTPPSAGGPNQAPPGFAPPGAPAYPPPAGAYPPPQAGAYPPPAGAYPPPVQGGYPPPAGYGSPGGMQPATGGGTPGFNTKNVGTSDWIIIGAGLVLLIFSFFGWLSVSLSFAGYSDSASTGAWHEYWWLATVLGVTVAVVVALRTMMGQAVAQVKPLFLVIAAAVGFLITLIALIEIFSKTTDSIGISSGPGIGIWICLIVSAAQTYFVWLWAQKQPGWTLPKLPGPAL